MSLNGSPSELKQLPMLVLQKLLSYDYTCRERLMPSAKYEDKKERSISKKKYDDYSDSEDELSKDVSQQKKNEMHPVDCILALLLCSDAFLRQDLLYRLSKFQLAVPFIFPEPFTNDLTVLLWSLRSIVKSWKTGKENQEKTHCHSLVSYQMPIISFLRFGAQRKGALSISKSKIINDVISDDNYDRFFNRHCRGGEYKYVLANGLVDMSWYLPGAESVHEDIFSDAVTFLNLHGDARHYPCQSSFLANISSMCIIILMEENLELNLETKSMLERLNSSQVGITFLNATDKKHKELRNEFRHCCIINLADKSNSERKDAIRGHINLTLPNIIQYDSIENWCFRHSEGLTLDENTRAYQIGFQHAKELKSLITNAETDPLFSKDLILPLQGDDLWKTWAFYDKELHRQNMKGRDVVEDYTEKTKDKKTSVRDKQFKIIENLTPVMESFLKSLLKFSGSSHCLVRNYFLHNLKLELESISRKEISKMQEHYYNLVKTLVSLNDDESSKSVESQRKISQLKDDLEKLRNAITSSSLGVENLIRELGQIYEAASESKLKKKQLLSQLPKLAAELLIDGNPLEIMDGDAGHVPLKWIKAVLQNLVEILIEPNVFVLSVLGLQSTGKSTMLNTTFGLKFKVSGGRCTRGAFMQLLTLDKDLRNETKCDYVLIIDAEGLRAPELDQVKIQNHDNELATFVIGLANMTLVNIYGEVPGDIDDILQTSVHAFLRMTKVRYSPSCQFIHQNAADTIKGEVGRTHFFFKLDGFTVMAASEENCER